MAELAAARCKLQRWGMLPAHIVQARGQAQLETQSQACDESQKSCKSIYEGPVVCKAKPATKTVKAFPMKKLKEMHSADEGILALAAEQEKSPNRSSSRVSSTCQNDAQS